MEETKAIEIAQAIIEDHKSVSVMTRAILSESAPAIIHLLYEKAGLELVPKIPNA